MGLESVGEASKNAWFRVSERAIEIEDRGIARRHGIKYRSCIEQNSLPSGYRKPSPKPQHGAGRIFCLYISRKSSKSINDGVNPFWRPRFDIPLGLR